MKWTSRLSCRCIGLLLAGSLIGPASASAQSVSVDTYPNPFGLLIQKGDGTFTQSGDMPCGGGGLPPATALLDQFARRKAGENLSTPYVRLAISIENWLHLVSPGSWDGDDFSHPWDGTYAPNRYSRSGVAQIPCDMSQYEKRRLAELATYRAYVNAGYKILLNVNYRGPEEDFGSQFSGDTNYAHHPLADSNDIFKRALAAALNEICSYSANGHGGAPEVICPENEENINEHTDVPKNLANYLTLLAAVADVAHNGLHSTVNGVTVNFTPPATRIQVTNGGLVDEGLRLVIWESIADPNRDGSTGDGDPSAAASFANNYMRYHNEYFTSDANLGVLSQLTSDPVGSGTNPLGTVRSGRQILDQTYFLLHGVTYNSVFYPGYAQLAQSGALDLFNFHFYGPWPDKTLGLTNPTSGPFSHKIDDELPVINDYIALFKSLSPPTPVITNEIGSWVSWEAENAWGSNAAANAVTSVLTKVHDELGLPYIVWYSGNKDIFFNKDADGIPNSNLQKRYIALTDDTGALLYTPNDSAHEDTGANVYNPPSNPNALGTAFNTFVTSRYNGDFWKSVSSANVFADTFSGASPSGWFCSATNTYMALDSGTLKLTNGGTVGRHAINYITASGSAKKLEVGDTLKLLFTFRFAGTASGTDALYFGLFNSTAGTRVASNNQGGSGDGTDKFNDYDGYRIRVPLAASTINPQVLSLDARQRTGATNSALFCTDTAYPSAVGSATIGGAALSANHDYTGTATITRTGYRELKMTFTLADGATTVYTYDSGYYNLAQPADGGAYSDSDIEAYSPFEFDAIGFGFPSTTTNPTSANFDNVSVDYQAAVKPTAAINPANVSISSSNIAFGASGSFTLNMTGGTDAQNWYGKWIKVNDGTSPSSSSNNATSLSTGTVTPGTYTGIVVNPQGWTAAYPAMLWVQSQIGVGTGAACSWAANTYTISSQSGGAIGASADACYFVNQPIASTSTIIAKVATPYGSSTADEAGVMMRSDNSTAGGQAVSVTLRRSNQGSTKRIITLQYRNALNGITTRISTTTLTATSCWVRLIRRSTGITAYYATVATTPTESDWIIDSGWPATMTDNLGNAAQGGLAVGFNSSSDQATFTNVSVMNP